MERFNIFRKMSSSTRCADTSMNKMITTRPITVFHKRIGKNIKVNLVFTTTKEGYTKPVIYSLWQDDLRLGDYFIYNNKHYFTLKEIKSPLLVNKLHRYEAIECNVEFNHKGSPHWATFIGSLSVKLNDYFKREYQVFNQEYMLIYPQQDITVGEELIIGNQQWRIEASDDITNAPIVYSTIFKGATTLLDKEPTEQIKELLVGVIYKFSTENYFFEADQKVEILRRTEQEITIKIKNLGFNSINIKTSQNGEIINENYVVKEM